MNGGTVQDVDGGAVQHAHVDGGVVQHAHVDRGTVQQCKVEAQTRIGAMVGQRFAKPISFDCHFFFIVVDCSDGHLP